MELYVRVMVDDTGSFIVKQEPLEQYGVNIDTLFSAAWKCTKPNCLTPYECK